MLACGGDDGGSGSDGGTSAADDGSDAGTAGDGADDGASASGDTSADGDATGDGGTGDGSATDDGTGDGGTTAGTSDGGSSDDGDTTGGTDDGGTTGSTGTTSGGTGTTGAGCTELDAGCPLWPASADDYVAGLTSYVSGITVPPRVNNAATCCRDFGAISKDFIESGTNEVDNGYSSLVETFDSLTPATWQQGIDLAINDGEMVILWDHHGLAGATDDFLLAELQGQFNVGTTYTEAGAGNGSFIVLRKSFVGGTGEPRGYYDPAMMAAAQLSATGATLFLPILGFTNIDVALRDTELTGSATINVDGVRYTGGELSGYLTLDDMFTAYNSYVASPECACLGVIPSPYVKDVNGEWQGQNCDAGAQTNCPDDPMCWALAGTTCSVVANLINGTADLDTEAGTAGYESLSVGLQWVGVEGQVAGIEP